MKLNKIVSPVSLWKRVLAFFIDFIIINLIVVLPFSNFFENIDVYSLDIIGSEIIFVSLIIIVLTLLYWVVLEYLLKQSVGKAILNVYVRSKDKNLKLWQCIVRNLTKVSLILLILDSLPVIFKNSYQRFFEKLSNTEVIDGEI